MALPDKQDALFSNIHVYKRLEKLVAVINDLCSLEEERNQIVSDCKSSFDAVRSEFSDEIGIEFPENSDVLSLEYLSQCQMALDSIIRLKNDKFTDFVHLVIHLSELQKSLQNLLPQSALDYIRTISQPLDQYIPTLEARDALKNFRVADITELHNVVEEASVLQIKLSSQLEVAISEINGFCRDLNMEGRFQLEKSLLNVQEYQRIADELRQQWIQVMDDKINNLLEALKGWWSKTHIPQAEQDKFKASIQQRSSTAVNKLEAEITRLKNLYEECKSVYDLIGARNSLLKKMKDFEISASDPKRLFRPSFQLVEEETFRKTCLPSLLKLEADLKKKILSYEKLHESRFLFNSDEGYLDLLENEISNRFINEAMFVLQ